MRCTTFVSALACIAGSASAQYVLQDTYDVSNFFSAFTFFSGPDPTHGFVDYATQNEANQQSLAGNSNGQVYLGVDSHTVNPAGGRASVRLSSNKAYTHGLFIADIAHMPGSTCGVWPAFWTFGPNWPSSGEIDIIEGVNTQTSNAVTLHTAAGCSMSNANSVASSSLIGADCNEGGGNIGCSQATTASYGTPFNQGGGGIYAMEWTAQHIAIWFFPRGAIPADVTSSRPNPAKWGPATSMFSGSGCSIDSHFSNHNIIFDTTFCGDWAGNVWGSNPQCAPLAATCNDYVAQNPAAFQDAYWLINSVKVYSAPLSMKERDVNATDITIPVSAAGSKRAVEFQS